MAEVEETRKPSTPLPVLTEERPLGSVECLTIASSLAQPQPAQQLQVYQRDIIIPHDYNKLSSHF